VIAEAAPTSRVVDPIADAALTGSGRRDGRIKVPEIAMRLDIGPQAVYSLLEKKIIPAIRLGRRWIITRHAYDQWERTCGTQTGTGLVPQTEVPVVT
jgi:excisionase family DNA binding protein